MKPMYFEEKDPEEVVTLTFDFTKDLAGETIMGAAVVTAAPYSGIDPSSAALLNGGPQIDGSSMTVLQSVKEGVAGVDYRMKAKVSTSTGRVLVLAQILPVRDA